MSTDEELQRRWREPSPYLVTVTDDSRGGRKHVSPSASRNTGDILSALNPRLPASGLVLEIASGTGQHCAAFAREFSGLTFQPSDPDPAARASIDAWCSEDTTGNIHPALDLNVTAQDWWAAVDGPVTAIIAINLLHISPWTATTGLFAGAGQLLAPDGMVITYGAYKRGGRHTAPSNADFDASLKHRDPDWGVRDIDDIADVARSNDLQLAEIVDMPSNNMLLVWRRNTERP
jgi:SAM-dependent methyltransferase